MPSREDAEGLTLEVFLGALEHDNLSALADDERLAWLRRVAHNKIIDSHRRSARRPVVALDQVADTTDFIDMNHGWVASGTTLYMTGDGGQSWTKVFPGDQSSSAFLTLDFVSDKIGWAINYDYSNQSYSLLKTVDGGHTWTKINYTVS